MSNPIEDAIKLLQDAGYDVFRTSACLVVGAQGTIHPEMLLSDGADRYRDSIRRGLARALSEHLYADHHIDFELIPAKEEDRPSWMDPVRLSERAKLKFYPYGRKEWRR